MEQKAQYVPPGMSPATKLAFLTMFILGVIATGNIAAKLITKFKGEKVTAFVVERPQQCNRRSRAKIEYAGKTYTVHIGRACELYPAGQRIPAFYHAGLDMLLPAWQRPEIGLGIAAVLWCLGVLALRSRIRQGRPKQANPVEDVEMEKFT